MNFLLLHYQSFEQKTFCSLDFKGRSIWSLEETLDRSQIGVLLKNLSFSNYSKWVSSIANISVSRHFFWKDIFFILSAVYKPAYAPNSGVGHMCTALWPGATFQKSLCLVSTSHTPQSAFFGGSNYHFQISNKFLRQQQFNATSQAHTAPCIWWVPTVWLWLCKPSTIPAGGLGCFLKEPQQKSPLASVFSSPIIVAKEKWGCSWKWREGGRQRW